MAWERYTAEELEWQYNPRVTVTDPQAHFQRFVELSRETRAGLAHRLDVRYGDGPDETLDVYPAADPGGPVHVFFHGGYWRSQDKRDYAFVARDLVPMGVTVVVANYDLCPAVTVGDIVEEAARCVHYVYRNAAQLGGDPERLSVSGHSAGGQLVAKLAGYDWRGRYGVGNPVRSAVAVSGVFDLEPVRHTTLNEEIRLTAAEARRNSPLHDPVPQGVPLLLAVGAEESPEFRRQTETYAAACRRAGAEVAQCRVPQANHFSVLEGLYLCSGVCFDRFRESALEGRPAAG